MPVVSDYYTRSLAHKNAHRHGSIDHPQDISFLDQWYYENDNASKQKAAMSRRYRRTLEPRPEKFQSESGPEADPEDVQYLFLRQPRTYVVLALVIFLLQYPFLLAFAISVPIIFSTMGSFLFPHSLTSSHSTLRTSLQILILDWINYLDLYLCQNPHMVWHSYLVLASVSFLLLCFLARTPLMLAFVIAVPIILCTLGPFTVSHILTFVSDITRAVLGIPAPAALERRQSFNVYPNTPTPAPLARRGVLRLFDYRTWFPATSSVYESIDPIHQQRRTFEEALADTLPRVRRSFVATGKEVTRFVWDLVKFLAKCSLVLTSFQLLVAYFRGEVLVSLADLNALVRTYFEFWWGWIYGPTRLLVWELPKALGEVLWASVGRVLALWWGWIYGLDRLLFWDVPEAQGHGGWVSAIKSVVAPGKYIRGRVAGRDTMDAWGNWHHLAHDETVQAAQHQI